MPAGNYNVELRFAGRIRQPTETSSTLLPATNRFRNDPRDRLLEQIHDHATRQDQGARGDEDDHREAHEDLGPGNEPPLDQADEGRMTQVAVNPLP